MSLLPLTHSALIEMGLSPSAIRHRLQTGAYQRVYSGVYIDRDSPFREAQTLAAWLKRCGPGAALSHHSAARFHGLDSTEGWDSEIHITQMLQHKTPTSTGLQVHRSRTLAEDQVIWLEGLRYTNRARTTLDLLAIASLHEGQRILESAFRGDDPKQPHLWRQDVRAQFESLVAAHPRHPGSTNSRQILSKLPRLYVPTGSIAETAVVQATEAAGHSVLRQVHISAPDSFGNHKDHFLDTFIDQLCLNIEVDGPEHLQATRRRADLERDRRLARGKRTLRFQASTALFEPEKIQQAIAEEARRQRYVSGTRRPVTDPDWVLIGTGLTRKIVRRT